MEAPVISSFVGTQDTYAILAISMTMLQHEVIVDVHRKEPRLCPFMGGPESLMIGRV